MLETAAMVDFYFSAFGEERKATYHETDTGLSVECDVIYTDIPPEMKPGFEGIIAEMIYAVAIRKDQIAQPKREARLLIGGRWYRLEKRIEDTDNMTRWIIRYAG